MKKNEKKLAALIAGTLVLYGGMYGLSPLALPLAEAAEVSDQTVTVASGGTEESVYGGSANVQSGAEAVLTQRNTVNVYGTVMFSTYGGDAYTSGTGSATASGNTVNVYGKSGSQKSDYLVGGIATATAASAATAEASNNTVNVCGTVTGSIIVGSADALGGTAIAAKNTVNIYGTVTGDVVAGMCSESWTANTVTLSDNSVNFCAGSVGGTLYGWLIGQGHTPTTLNTSGKTLNVRGTNLSAQDIKAFQNIYFYLPSTVTNGSTLLTLTTTGTTDLSGVTLGAAVASGAGPSLAVGDTVNLLTTSGTLTTDTTLTNTISGMQGISTMYEMSIANVSSKSLVATVTRAALAPQTKSLVETQLGTLSLLTGGMDMLAGPGLANAASAVAANVNASAGGQPERGSGTETAAAGTAGSSGMDTTAGAASGKSPEQPEAGGASRGQRTNAAAAARTMTPFAAMGGSALRQHSGSYVDVRGVNLSLGFAKEVRNAQGTLLFGPILEYGKGSYTSHLDDGTRGDGNTHYYGGGIFARETQANGFYYEGSLRAGRTTADYRSSDLSGATGSADGSVRYDPSAAYWGAHLGLGRIVTLAGGSTLDFCGKYFHARTAGDDVTLSSGEAYHFDAVNSDRLRIGGRYTHPVNTASSIYAGLAYQYEFSGDSRAHYSGMTTASPSVKGGSGMLELGWQMKPGDTSPVTVDLGLTGWVGRQQGVTFQAGAQWAF